MVLPLQVVSLFVVTLTAAGCLYFLDSDAVAKTSGLDAAGILLVLMNLAYASVMVILISVTARHKAVQFVRKLHIRALVCVQRTTAAASQFPGRVRLLKQSSSKYLLTQKPHASNLQRGGTDDLHANKLASKVSLQRLLALSNSFRVHRSLSSNSGTAGQPSSITKDVGDDDIT